MSAGIPLAEATWLRDALRIVGTDALTYLQGQVSCDVAAIGIGESSLALLLQPNGKLDALLGLCRTDEHELVVSTDPGAVDLVEARLRRFLLRSDVSIERAEVIESAGAIEQSEPGGALLPAQEVARIRAGWPLFGAEIHGEHSGEVIPAEIGPWLIDAAVSFTKGCYVGQELTARINSRGGNVPRRLRGFDLPSGVAATPGEPIVVAGEESVEPKGTVTSALTDPATGAVVAMGYVHRSVGDDATLSVAR